LLKNTNAAEVPAVNRQTALRHAQQKLAEANCSNANQEARWMLEQLLSEDKLPANCGLIPQRTLQKLGRMLTRRQNGEPLQYILGNSAFHCLELLVGPGVLIPRPETEILVEEALRLYSGQGMVCDLCTGSGAIPLAMAKNLPHTTFLASDISKPALRWARLNQEKNRLANVTFFHGDLFHPFPPTAQFSLLTANPPYISNQEYEDLPPEVRDHEPGLALLGGADGLDLLRRIICEAPAHLQPEAWILLEIGSSQGEAVREMLRRAAWRDVRIRKDYAGHDRIAIARRPL
jgi:release factor glutamine methyltransferase